MEYENLLVGELESGKGSCSRSRGVRPLFTYLVDRLLNFAESVPFDECTDHGNNNDEYEEGECRGLNNMNQMSSAGAERH